MSVVRRLSGRRNRRIRPRSMPIPSHGGDSPDRVRWFRRAEPPCVLRVVLAHHEPHQTFLACLEKSRSDRAFRFAHKTVNETRRTPPPLQPSIETDDTSDHLRPIVRPVRDRVTEHRTAHAKSGLGRFHTVEPASLCPLLTTCQSSPGATTTRASRHTTSLISRLGARGTELEEVGRVPAQRCSSSER